MPTQSVADRDQRILAQPKLPAPLQPTPHAFLSLNRTAEAHLETHFVEDVPSHSERSATWPLRVARFTYALSAVR